MILSSLQFCLIKGVVGYGSADSPRTATELTAIWLKEMSETLWKALADGDEGGKGLKGYIPPNLCRDLELCTPTRHASDPLLPLCPPCSHLSFIWRRRVPNHLMLSCDVGEWQLKYHVGNVCVCVCVCVWGEGEMESVNLDVTHRMTDVCRIKAWENIGVYGLCHLLFKLDPPLFPILVQRASKAERRLRNK